VYIRENIRNIAIDRNRIRKLRKAFQEIMDRIDNQGYAHVASHHGWMDGLCEHQPETDQQGNVYHNFLPWHRAYLLKLEKLLQQRDPDVSLPWWNWRSEQSKRGGIPKVYAVTMADKKPNPLYKFSMKIKGRDNAGFDVNVSRDTFRTPGNPEEIRVRQEGFNKNELDIPQLYSLSDFRQFSERLRIGWHNYIHMWVGGDMGVVSTAAYDPIFYAHHCNIDRIWAIWQTIHGVDSVPSHMLDVVLQPFKVTVKDVLDINSLNYDYASSTTL
jgi:tyrosinase